MVLIAETRKAGSGVGWPVLRGQTKRELGAYSTKPLRILESQLDWKSNVKLKGQTTVSENLGKPREYMAQVQSRLEVQSQLVWLHRECIKKGKKMHIQERQQSKNSNSSIREGSGDRGSHLLRWNHLYSLAQLKADCQSTWPKGLRRMISEDSKGQGKGSHLRDNFFRISVTSRKIDSSVCACYV